MNIDEEGGGVGQVYRRGNEVVERESPTGLFNLVQA